MRDASDVAPAGADFLKLLADPTRRRIFLLLMKGETCNCEVSEILGVPENLVSHHLRKLRESGLVEEHPDPLDGRWVHYTVSATGLSTAWNALAEMFRPGLLGSRRPICHVRPQRTRRVVITRATGAAGLPTSLSRTTNGHELPLPGQQGSRA